MFKPLLFLGVVGACLLNSNLFAQLNINQPPQETPVLAKARYNGKYYPICDASGLIPKVKVEGKTVEADSSPRIRVTPGKDFGKGIVKFEEAKLTHWSEQQTFGGTSAGDALPLSLSFSGKLTSDTNLEDCSLIIIFYRPSTIEKPGVAAPFYLAGIKEIGTLKAGKTKRVTVDYDVSLLKSFERHDFAWFAVVQSGEEQIRHSGAPNAADALFRALIEWHRAKGGSS